MLFSSWLRNGKRSAPAARRRRQTSPRQRASFRPRLEALEDRLTPSTGYVQTNLTANPQPDPQQNYQQLQARFTDNNLNGWGMTSMPNGSFCVANAFANGTATFYEHSGQPLALKITVPVEAGESAYLSAATGLPISTTYGHPTGVVYNPTNDFVISENGKSAPATLIFDTLDGTICGWNPVVDPTHAIVIRDTWAAGSPAVYTSLEIGQETGQDGQVHNVLYAADFLNNRLEVINGSFQTINTTDCSGLGVKGDSFSSAWSVSAVNGKLYVTFADLLNPDASYHADGAVDEFDAQGNFVRQLDATGPGVGSGAYLHNPWGVTLAPANFGTYSNDLLVGNVAGAGNINVYKPDTNGNYTIYAGQLSKPDGTPIAIKGLWDMEFDDGPHLFFDAGPNYPGDGYGGLFGVIRPAPVVQMMAVHGSAPVSVSNHSVGTSSSPPNVSSGQDQGAESLSLMAKSMTMAPASGLQAMEKQIDAYFQSFNAAVQSWESDLLPMDPQLSGLFSTVNDDLDAWEAMIDSKL